MLLTVLHVSDIHCGPPFLDRVAEAVHRVASEIQPDAVVVSGDLTQRAKREQFERARRWMEGLPPAPRLVVPGNHDVPLYRVWERLTRPYAAYEAVHGDREGVMRVPGAIFVGLDSTAAHRTITRGQLTARQVDWAIEQLQDADPDDARIVVAHHHFADAPDTLRDRSMLGGGAAVRKFIEAGVDIILGGHLHRAFIGNSLDFFFEGPRDRGIIVVQAGTATSRRGRGRERERNSINVVRFHGSWIEVTHHMYFDDEDAFSPLSHHVFTRAGHRFGETVEETLTARSDELPLIKTREVET